MSLPPRKWNNRIKHDEEDDDGESGSKGCRDRSGDRVFYLWRTPRPTRQVASSPAPALAALKTAIQTSRNSALVV